MYTITQTQAILQVIGGDLHPQVYVFYVNIQ